MFLDMVQSKNETKEFLFSITKNCETLIKQTHRHSEETSEFKLTKSREIFTLKPSINFDADLIGRWEY